MHYETIKWMENPDFLKKRSQYLSLDFEASGFFAGKIDLLRRIAPNAPILLIFREFDSWVESFINYFSELSRSINYNYPLRIIFDKITIYPVDRFFDLSSDHKNVIIKNLWNYWLNSFKDAAGENNVLIVDINNIDDNLIEIAEFLDLPTPTPGSDNLKRIRDKKLNIDLWRHIDMDDVRQKTKDMKSLLKHI